MKKVIPILIAVFIGATCSDPTPTVAQETKLSPDEVAAETAVVEEKSQCAEGSEVIKIKIHLKKGGVIVDPYTAEATRGDELRFKIIINGNVDEIVQIGGKESDGVWIDKQSTKGAEKFFVCVDPEDEIPKNEEKTYKYFVFVPRVGFIDPEVIVRN